MGQSQEVREDLCLQEYHVHLVLQAILARLSLGEIPVEEQIFIMKWIVSRASKEKVGAHLPELLLVLEFQVVRHDRVDHLDREDQVVQGSRCHLSLLFHRSLSEHHPDLLFLQGIPEPLEVQENPGEVEE